MKFSITNTKKIPQIPSGSGIAKSEDTYYIIGDDSPFLFALNEQYAVISQTRIIDSGELVNGRIPKSLKPDFESLEMIGEKEIIVFGSGSKSPQRDVFIHILLEEPLHITKYEISHFYDELRDLPELEDSELNIEATAFHNNQLYLFNRKKNLILKFEYSELFSYIKGERDFPKPETKQFTLPEIDGIEAGFSGATVLKSESKIIFTASAEDTDNAYDDGEILGSMIGIIDISNERIANSFKSCSIPNGKENYKVESVTVKEQISSGETKVVLITDDDIGNSLIIEGILRW